MDITRDRRAIAGVVLVGVGLLILAKEWLGLPDVALLGAVGAALLVAYAVSRRYGFLIPGMIMLFAAVGTGLQDAGYDEMGGWVGILSGAGFIAIYVVDVFVSGRSRWWPLIPGTILVLIGAEALGRGTIAGDAISRSWPIALVVAGVIVLISARRRAPTPGRSH